MAHTNRKSSAELYDKVTVAAVVFAIIFEIGYLFGSNPPFDALGYLIGRDFVNTWMGARAALDGQPSAWFEFYAYNDALRSVFGPTFPPHNWSYPPHLLLFTWPFGFLPYLPAYIIWCIAGFALYMAVTGRGEHRMDRLLMLAVAPAVIMNVLGGQNGFFTAGLLIGGLSLLDRRPVVSGILFGLLTIKPQLGLLLPLMLVLTGRWRCILSAAATTLVLVVATAAIFGPDIWLDYVRVVLPFQKDVLTSGTGIALYMMPTTFMSARIANLPLAWAWTAQAIVSVLAIAAVAWTFWRRRDPVLSLALFIAASFIVTPYVFNYDMVVFGWVVAKLRDRESNSGWDDGLAIAVWTLPVTTMILGLAHVPLACIPLIAFAGRLVWRIAQAETEKRSDPVLQVSA